MKMNSLKLLSAVIIGLVALSSPLYAQGNDSRIGNRVIEATAIAKEDAQKKYPPPSAGYPMGERDPHEGSGIVTSPYPPNQKYDCSKINHGALVIDSRVKKVFVRP